MTTELDLIRADLMHQLKIPDELDWDYFLETAKRAKDAADEEGRNMTMSDDPNDLITWIGLTF